ncbi:MAG TPA: 50S ribosomal protein L6 [Clostridiaceae bacterium]|jgi:large subunit ribosomal protein L6|nr:50S ribosomal protein L6 [Clostridiaceae bacterium]
MSRIGRAPITIPEGVNVTVKGQHIEVSDGKTTLNRDIHPAITVEVKDNEIRVTRGSDTKEHRSLHGLTRSLINNMVVGVKQGFQKTLEVNGIGYRALKQGDKLVLNVGYSHPVEFTEPEGLTYDVPAPNRIIVKGADKQLVGEMAAKIRASRLPDAYKGKGIKYDYEVLKLKEGKSGAK